jgi:hypothetical protein
MNLGKVHVLSAAYHIGRPIATPFVDMVPEGNRDWFKSRLGLNNGLSFCRTVCVVHPKDVDVTYRISFSETGGDGASQKQSSQPAQLIGKYDTPDTAVSDAATGTQSEKSVVFCATGKHWSDRANRWFTVTAIY